MAPPAPARLTDYRPAPVSLGLTQKQLPTFG
jgi:hypothetical protein